MLKLRTKTEFSIPTKRGVTQGIVRLIIDKLEIDINNIRPTGYYYYYNEEGQVVKLDDISANTVKQWEMISVVETDYLSPMTSTTSLKSNLLQRVKEFTMLQLAQEGNQNYNTNASDWEEDID